LYKWALRVVERCALSAAPSQPKGEKKHHNTIGDMMAALSHVLSSISRGGTQWVYGGRLFVVSARTNKRHHHLDLEWFPLCDKRVFQFFSEGLLFITAVPNTKLCVWGEEDSGGQVL
jgi:hypothetical protein